MFIMTLWTVVKLSLCICHTIYTDTIYKELIPGRKCIINKFDILVIIASNMWETEVFLICLNTFEDILLSS